MHTRGCKQFLRPLGGQLQGLLGALAAGPGDDHLAYTGLKRGFYHLLAVNIE